MLKSNTSNKKVKSLEIRTQQLMLQYIERKINTYTMSDYIMQVLTIKIVMSLDEIQSK